MSELLRTQIKQIDAVIKELTKVVPNTVDGWDPIEKLQKINTALRDIAEDCAQS